MNKDGKRAIICAALALPLSLVVSGTIAWYLKANNPDNVDITAGLAYLRPILVSAFVTFGVLMLVAFVSALRGRRRDASPELSTLGLALIITLVLVSLVAGVASNRASKAEDRYRDQQTQEFFDKLKNQ
jgi:uncharacterized membrane protein